MALDKERKQSMKTAGFLAFVGALFFGLAQPAPAQTATDADVIGMWTYATSYNVGLAGDLTITRRGANWEAAIAGQVAQGTAANGEVRIVFANEGGLIRGRTDSSGRLAGAFWVRRAATDDPRSPRGAFSYATPLELRAAGRNQWRATVRPLADPLTFYVHIFRDSDGALKAAIRNPEKHSHGPAHQFAVTRTGDTIQLSDADSDWRLDAQLLREPERIEMQWDDFGGRISLTRIAPEKAQRFWPRPLGSAPYVYRQPETTGDGWRTARAGDLGVDEAALARAVQRIQDVDPSAARGVWLIHSVAVAYRGRLILDEYFYGFGRDEPHDMRSASKTLSSVILGATMMEGVDISPQTPLYPLFASMGPFANPDPRKDGITVGHALTHTTGLACDDYAEDPVSPGNEDAIADQTAQPNWWKFTLDLPMAYEPGEHYAYCSANINLAGGALTMATGEWLPALFDRTIARPLQWGEYHWNIMPNGEGYVGGGAYVRTRDFLKLGQMMLNKGKWNGRRIMPEDWVRESVEAQAQLSLATTGLSPETFAERYYEVGEGYAWHLIDVQSGDRTYPAFHANGNGGQLLIVVPELDLAVMFTAGNYRQGLWNIERDAIVGDMIIPALNRTN